MSLTILDTDISGGGAAYTATATEETIVLTEGTTLISTGSSGIYNDGSFENTNVVVAGSVFTSGNAVNLRASAPSAGNHSVTVLESGVIVAETFTGILIEGANSIATNYGQITTSRSIGMFLSDSDFGSLINYGTVTPSHPGLYSSTMGVDSNVTAAHIENHGILTSNGTVEGALNIEASGTVTFLNTGTVTTTGQAYASVNQAVDTVINTGLIRGEVNLGGGGDIFAGLGGTIDGRILAGGGNDDIRISGSSDWVHGGAGADVLYTDGDATTLYQIETVRLLGTDGVHVGGDITATTYYGSLGDDVVEAGAGNDVIYGRGGNDELHGGLGDDTIRGGMGDDEIRGGEGLDRLIGDAGADTYVFANIAEMSAGTAGDRIELEQGVDLIDLSNIADGVIDFIGGAAFSGTAVAEVRVIAAASGHGIVMVDINGDGAEDARLVILDNSALTADDFLL